MPADASAQLRWYHLRDLNEHHHKRHKRDFEEAKKFRTQQRVNVLFGKLAQCDPLHHLTTDMMRYYLERLPSSARRAVERMFTRCPHEAMEFYSEIREAAETYLRHYRERPSRSR